MEYNNELLRLKAIVLDIEKQKEKRKEYYRLYNIKNREKKKEYSKNYREKNKAHKVIDPKEISYKEVIESYKEYKRIARDYKRSLKQQIKPTI